MPNFLQFSIGITVGNSTFTETFLIPFPVPVVSVTFYHPPLLLETSHTAAYDWSSNADLHLWSKCQESSPILKCTVVIWLSDSLVWSQEWLVLWMYLATVSGPSPTLLPKWRRRVRWGKPGPVAFFFQSGNCVPKPWNSPLCGMMTCNFILHLEDWLFTMCVKYFWKWWSWILWLLCIFCCLRKPIKVYIAVNMNQKPNISMKT